MHLQVLPTVTNKEWYFVSILNKIKWALLFGGERVLLYQRKWSGTRCPNWDQVRKQHQIDGVEDTCYGTGFQGGYSRSLEVYVSIIGPSASQVVVHEEGVKTTFTPRSWSLWEPTLRNMDFIVRQNGERLWIQNVTATKWKGKTLRQLFDLALVEKNHPIYRIPV